MSIAGIGIDIVSSERVARLHERYGARLERRLMADQERGALPADPPARRRRLALAFAAKEALGKALGSGIRAPASWHQIAVERDALGAPGYRFGARLGEQLRERGIGGAHLSLSDDGGMAVAVAVLERG